MIALPTAAKTSGFGTLASSVRYAGLTVQITIRRVLECDFCRHEIPWKRLNVFGNRLQ